MTRSNTVINTGESMTHWIFICLALIGLSSLPAHAGARAANGVYAMDCLKPGSGYIIDIKADNMVTIEKNGKTYKNGILSYSFLEEKRHADFVVAILFDDTPSPIYTRNGKPSWIEIWNDGTSLYALENGKRSARLAYCGRLDEKSVISAASPSNTWIDMAIRNKWLILSAIIPILLLMIAYLNRKSR